MIKIYTPVSVNSLPVQFSLDDKITVLGSCFADSMGARLAAAGFSVCVNPFGTLYNPVSVYNSAARLSGGVPFTEKDCVEMGAGAGLVCSFSHHTSFAKPTAEEFLRGANASLAEASAFWKDSDKVIVTLGTAMVWKLAESGEVVSNCLKRPAAEFSHEMLSTEQVSAMLSLLVRANPGKEFLFTVSPIRHMSGGAQLNTLSKSTLHLALARLDLPYFPAYEILLDELRDYRFYAEDLCHPSKLAEDIIWERFLESAVPERELPRIRLNEKASRAAAHRPLHG